MKAPKAYSLIELLICVAIVIVLAGIAIASYQGALDNGDIKYAAPAVVGMLENLRREASEKAMVIRVDFEIGSSRWTVTRRRGEQETTRTQDMAEMSLIRRRLRFLRYEWPDGAKTPASFTFLGTSAPQGGTVYFGTGRAETAIQVTGGRVFCEHGIRNP